MLKVIVELADESRQIGDSVAGFTYPGAWTSRVFGLGAREPVTRPLMEEIVNFYRGGKTRYASTPHPMPIQRAMADASRIRLLRRGLG